MGVERSPGEGRRCSPRPWTGGAAIIRLADEPQQPLEQLERRRRTAADHEVDRHDLRHRAHAGVAPGEDTTAGGAITDGDDPLGRRGCGVGALERLAHVERHRAGDEQRVRVAGRGDETDAEALDVVEGVVERVDLELARVAGSRIDLADRETAPEAPRDGAAELRAEGLELPGRLRTQGFRAGLAQEVLEESAAHRGTRSCWVTGRDRSTSS